MNIIRWINNKFDSSSEFEKTFSYLTRLGGFEPSSKNIYVLLKELNSNTHDLQSDILIAEINKIQYASNTNDFFYFYFPLVSHILYYKPKYEIDLLRFLIGPNFANGTTETKKMMLLIVGAMKFKLAENTNYLTHESQEWIINEFPKLESQVEREIQVCWKELGE